MEDGRIPEYLGRRPTGRAHLRYKHVCIRDMKDVDIDTMSWEGLAADRTKWSALKTTPQDRRRQTDDCSSGQAITQQDGQQLHPTRNHTYIIISCYNPARKKNKKNQKKSLGCIIHGHLPTEASMQIYDFYICFWCSYDPSHRVAIAVFCRNGNSNKINIKKCKYSKIMNHTNNHLETMRMKAVSP